VNIWLSNGVEYVSPFSLSSLPQVLKYGFRMIGCKKSCSVDQFRVGWRVEVPILVPILLL